MLGSTKIKIASLVLFALMFAFSMLLFFSPKTMVEVFALIFGTPSNPPLAVRNFRTLGLFGSVFFGSGFAVGFVVTVIQFFEKKRQEQTQGVEKRRGGTNV